MKKIKDHSEAYEHFTDHEKNGFIQWKGTDVCLDFTCECGTNNHYDDYSAYAVQCSGCGSYYALSPKVEMLRVETGEDALQSVLIEMEPDAKPPTFVPGGIMDKGPDQIINSWL